MNRDLPGEVGASEILCPAPFITKEQAQAGGSLRLYWRSDDPLCGKLLNTARDPRHFPVAKAFFPFIRTASVLHVPRALRSQPAWLNLAFHAGFIFGETLPEKTEQLLEHNGVERNEALRRLRIVHSLLGRRPPTLNHIWEAFGQIHERQWAATPAEKVCDLLVENAFNVFKVGLAAATLERMSEEIITSLRSTGVPLASRLLMLSAFLDFGRPACETMAHPLLRVGATNYLDSPIEGETILAFIHQQLARWGRLSEDECPVADEHIEAWVTAALEFGRTVRASHPERIDAILDESGPERRQETKELIEEAVQLAKGTEPHALTAAILRWHNETYEWCDRACHGEYLARVVHAVDFAIWVGWIE